MKKTISAVGVLTLFASLALASPGDGPRGEGSKGRHGGKHGMRGGMELTGRMAEKLGLTDDQKTQIRAMEQSFRDRNASLMESFRSNMEDFRAAKQANDTARIEALRPAMESNRAQMKQLREAQHQKLLSVLTADQRTRLQEMKSRHQERMNDRDRGDR